MSELAALFSLPALLLPWYEANKRDLPWRADRQPYHVWLSEIMLQQTRVEAAKGYYLRFLEALPTMEDLAACGEDRLTKLWEGLGYYSRVRNLQKAARVIVQELGGIFPTDYETVLSLPGIGEYTAGAICSIAFNQPVPAVDGNVLRVMARLQNDASPIDDPHVKARVRQQLLEVYPEQAGSFTQALMELGATVCGPNRRPDCALCPVHSICRSYQAGTCERLPVKSPKKPRRTEEKTVFILRCQDLYALRKRPKTGLLAGLWEFPNVPGRLDTDQALQQLSFWGLHPSELFQTLNRSHIFTHIQWNMDAFVLEVREPGGELEWFTAAQIDENAALPTAFRQFWEALRHV